MRFMHGLMGLAPALVLAAGCVNNGPSAETKTSAADKAAAQPAQSPVERGKYLVTVGGCNDCHTHPSYLAGHNPFLGQPELINAPQYLSGGRTFPPSPFVSADITPDATGKPAGLTFEQFKEAMRTGHNPLDPPGVLLQIMPWPVFGKKTDGDLRAVYEYLSTIPSLPDNPHPGP